MLKSKTQAPKLRYNIIACLIIGLSFLATIPATAETQSIGSAGGEVYAGHNSYLIVPAGALTNEELISAENFEAVITSDDTSIVKGLNKILVIIDSQYTYIDRLPTQQTISDEWVATEEIKTAILTRVEAIQDNVTQALQLNQEDDDVDALLKIRKALVQLDDLAVYLKSLCQGRNRQLGRIAYETIVGYSNDAVMILEMVESMHYETLVFEFGPEGTEFLISAELVIPWEEILYNDALFWYSASGEVINLSDIDYFIDEVNETVHFLIDHFSYYYYQRR